MILLTSIVLLLTACEKDGPKPYVTVMPDRFMFTVLDSRGQALFTDPNQKVVLSLLQNGQNREIIDYRLEPFPPGFPLTGYAYSSRDAAMVSGNAGVRDFYLEMNGDVDTVYLEVEKYQQANAAGGLYSYRKVRFNGQDISEQYKPGVYIYVFQKR